jgi:tripartite-type tricarboxylate transporter receptor subunit TctC
LFGGHSLGRGAPSNFRVDHSYAAWVRSGGIPTEIIDKLNKEINAALVDPMIKAKLAEQGGEHLPGSLADCRKLIGEEIEK